MECVRVIMGGCKIRVIHVSERGGGGYVIMVKSLDTQEGYKLRALQS
jgi:hypothetical protein